MLWVGNTVYGNNGQSSGGGGGNESYSAGDIAFTPTDETKWTSVPTTVQEALDIAATNTSIFG